MGPQREEETTFSERKEGFRTVKGEFDRNSV